ncbi:MAG: alpha/beta hydrolase [Herbiconiux sp.]|nr:alpha/beta hydrolase [Herbiconiux sp.]
MSVASPYAEQLARTPTATRVLTLAGSDTHVWEYGRAGTDAASRADARILLVVVHGFRGDHHGLEPVIAQLGSTGTVPGLRIVAPDLPGFGVSTPLTATHDIDGYAAWLRAFVDTVRAESPAARVVLLGHSFGSILVSAALATGPGVAADAAVLVNPISAPALTGPRGVMTRLAIGYYRFSAAVPEKLGFAILRSPLVVRVISITMAKTHDKGLRRWIHDQHDRYFSAFANRAVVLDAFRASVSHDVSEYAERIAVPTLMIAADNDDITPIEAQHAVQQTIPDARLVILDDVGHLIHYERPVEAAAAVTEFLTRG